MDVADTSYEEWRTITPAPSSSRNSTESSGAGVVVYKPAPIAGSHPGPPNFQSLFQSNYDEDKCRGVLVRFCGHVPRNYQYQDGLQKVFLILRDHVGDENMDMAGGVLYELIEIDCDHTDDPGAAFQRWKCDHMRRHTDLLLPHVPHMMTITSKIVPTERLFRWRATHPERYPFRLSDSAGSSRSSSADTSLIRTSKTWIIENTLFVSSRRDGTRPVRRLSPQEFHEKQWDPEFGSGGRLVGERVVDISQQTEREPPQPLAPPPKTRTSLGNVAKLILRPLSQQTAAPPRRPREGIRRSWFSSMVGFDPVTSVKELLDNRSVPLPRGAAPHGVFARKFALVEDGKPIPAGLGLHDMRTAEDRAMESLGATSHSPAFRGPFTPQLGYDGGLDFRWRHKSQASTNARPTSTMTLASYAMADEAFPREDVFECGYREASNPVAYSQVGPAAVAPGRPSVVSEAQRLDSTWIEYLDSRTFVG